MLNACKHMQVEQSHHTALELSCKATPCRLQQQLAHKPCWCKVLTQLTCDQLLTCIVVMLQDCGKPWYVENYIAFFAAIRARYPHMRLISNCDMDPHAPTDLFDWHLYTDTQNMFDRRHEFDNIPNIQDKKVFASEYAVFDEPAGHNIQFPGNLKVSFRVHSSCFYSLRVLH